MFINTFDAPVTDKNLPSFWCNAFLHRNVVNEPSFRGHLYSMPFKHGLNKHPLARIHEAIKRRCTVSCASGYHRYGGRGIKMCDEWINNLKAFYDWSISNGYRNGLSIDRIDNNGNYEPSNCRWVDDKTQARNRRDNRIIEYKGLKKSLAEWAEYYNINYWCLRSRLRRSWSMDKAITTPINKKRSA